MSARNPFEPPEAVVVTARPTPRERMTKLAIAGAVIAWVFAPFVLAILLAAVGAVQVHGQVRASREPS